MVLSDTIIDYLKGAHVIVVLLVIYGGLVAAWVRLRIKVSQMESQIKEFVERHTKCSQLQSERFQELKEEIGGVDKKLGVMGQKLDDFIEWSKNGGGKRG